MSKLPQIIPMSQRTRALMLSVIDDYPSNAHVMHWLWNQNFRRMDEMLAWLVLSGITGKTLNEWIFKIWDRSLLGMAQFIIMRLEKSSAPRPLLCPQDYSPLKKPSEKKR